MTEILTEIKDFVGDINPEYLLEIFLIYVVIYTFLRFMEGTRGEGILKGIALVILTVPIVISIFSHRFGVLQRLEVILRFFSAAAIPAIVVIVAPELRRALVRLGQRRLFGLIFKGEAEEMVDEIVKAAFRMARRKVGALIAIEREVGLKNYIERGTPIDGIISSQILSTLFFPGSELHDGAVIIRNNRIAAAGCLFPLSEHPHPGESFGTRHRAALGLSEETDAVIVVVSEESGVVSFAHDGSIERPMNPDQLREALLKFYAQMEDKAVERTREELEEPSEHEILTPAKEGDGDKPPPGQPRYKQKAEV